MKKADVYQTVTNNILMPMKAMANNVVSYFFIIFTMYIVKVANGLASPAAWLRRE